MVATKDITDLQFDLELDISLGELEPELKEIIGHDKTVQNEDEKVKNLSLDEERLMKSSSISTLSSQEDLRMSMTTSSSSLEDIGVNTTSSSQEDIRMNTSPSCQNNKKISTTLVRQECIDDMNDTDRRSVFVRNVDYCTTEEELEHHFLGNIRPINRVTILCNKYDGLPRGCAYVEFAHQECVQAALELDDSLLRGRHIKVVPKRTTRPGLSCGGHAFIGRLGKGDYIVEFHEEANWIKFLTKTTRSLRM